LWHQELPLEFGVSEFEIGASTGGKRFHLADKVAFLTLREVPAALVDVSEVISRFSATNWAPIVEN